MRSTLPREWEILERATTQITGILTREDGVTPVPGSILTAFTITIYDTDEAKTVIVDARNILNANNSTVTEQGLVTIILDPADVPIRTDALPFERHIALLNWTWGSAPVKQGRHEIALIHRNLAKVS